MKNKIYLEIKHYYQFSKLIILILPIIVSVSSFAQEDQNSAADQLVSLLAESQTLQATVEQITLSQDGVEIEQLQARLKMQKPDHFYWEVVAPYPELIVTNGEKIWRYEEDLEQVTIQTFDDGINSTPLMLLNANAQELTDAFEIDYQQNEEYSEFIRFFLLPVEKTSLYERLSLSFENGTLIEMQIESSLGQKTSLHFSELVINQNIKAEQFEFMVPANLNIDIIDTTL